MKDVTLSPFHPFTPIPTIPPSYPFLLLTLSLILPISLSSQSPQVQMVYVEGGTFEMGCKSGRDDINGLSCFSSESPLHMVTLSDYSIGKYEVSQREWEQVMGNNPSNFNSCGKECPVEQVNWYAIIIFCNELSILHGYEPCYYTDPSYTTVIRASGGNYPEGGTDGAGRGMDVSWKLESNGYRLPTEAEWEYAARGGSASQGYQFSGSNTLEDVGWFIDNSHHRTQSKGMKDANELGIHDMSGNVWEWCWTDFTFAYHSDTQFNPLVSDSDAAWTYDHTSDACCPTVRGGSWANIQGICRSSFRNLGFIPGYRNFNFGFRLSRTP